LIATGAALGGANTAWANVPAYAQTAVAATSQKPPTPPGPGSYGWSAGWEAGVSAGWANGRVSSTPPGNLLSGLDAREKPGFLAGYAAGVEHGKQITMGVEPTDT